MLFYYLFHVKIPSGSAMHRMLIIFFSFLIIAYRATPLGDYRQ